ncbi:Rieske (2Fe-2S) protein [Haloarculaceae archaeon H-GB1-1]|nr:Rieske (2Fe-2S) protein [Haloarculaceae archaeon H-GB1-1]
MAEHDPEPELDEPIYEEQEMTRRQVAKTLTAVSGAAAIGGFTVDAIAGLSTAGSLAAEKAGGPVYVEGTRLVTEKGDPITVDSLAPDEAGSMTVFPEKEGGGAVVSARSTTILMRFPEGDYEKPTNVDGTAKGYVAYSAVCTHEGCAVGAKDGKIHCPCHQSIYDPLSGAEVTGGPAPRALPQLPLGVADDEDGTLVMATGPFEGPIGVSH